MRVKYSTSVHLIDKSLGNAALVQRNFLESFKPAKLRWGPNFEYNTEDHQMFDVLDKHPLPGNTWRYYGENSEKAFRLDLLD